MATLTMDKPQSAPVNSGQQKPSDGLTVATYMLAQLKAWGVKRMYGVIGDATLHLLDAIAKQSDIGYIACRHEEAAALMASAEAKLTGKLTVCLATSGPGAANLINGLADAHMDRAPVLAITGQVDTASIGTHAKQYINQQQLLGAVCGKTELLAGPDALPELLQSCLVYAKANGGVAHLSVPKDLYMKPVKGKVVPYGVHLHEKAAPPVEALNKASALLIASRRPVIVAGLGAAAAPAALLKLAESLNAAVITTYPARSAFPNDHPLYMGGLGQGGSEASSLVMAESDLIVVLGATWWPDNYVPAQARVVQFDLCSANIGVGHPVELGVVGDLAQAIPALLDKLAGSRQDRSGWKMRIGEAAAEWRNKLERETSVRSVPMQPSSLMKTISDLAAPDAVMCIDTGDHTLWFNRVFQAKKHPILVSGRWRTLGFALPAAIAAQLAHPDRQVIAIAGDGGVVQTIMEFQTAAERKLPIVVIVVNNGSYAMEKNRMELAGLRTLGSANVNPDFAKLAEALGGIGMRAETEEQLAACITRAFRERKPALIDAVTADTAVPHTTI